MFHLAFKMFRDLWNERMTSARTQGVSLQKDIRAIEHKVEQLLDRVVEATSGTMVAAYERIKDLEMQKALMREMIAH